MAGRPKTAARNATDLAHSAAEVHVRAIAFAPERCKAVAGILAPQNPSDRPAPPRDRLGIYWCRLLYLVAQVHVVCEEIAEMQCAKAGVEYKPPDWMVAAGKKREVAAALAVQSDEVGSANDDNSQTHEGMEG